MTNSMTTGPSHLTFDQAGDLYDAGRATSEDVFPCECWFAGNEGNFRHDFAYSYPEDSAASYQHPEEYVRGAIARFEYENDL